MFKSKLAAGLIGLLAATFIVFLGVDAGRVPTSDPTGAASTAALRAFTDLGAKLVATVLTGSDPSGNRDDDVPAGDDSESIDSPAVPSAESQDAPAGNATPTATVSIDDADYFGAERLRVYHGPKDDAAIPSVGPLGIAGVTDAPLADQIDAAQAANTLTLMPVADAYVRAGGDAGKNFGMTTSLKAMKASKDDNPPTQSYIRFDVGAVGSIAKATLRFYCNNDSRDSFDVFVTAVNWDEKTVTWNNKPAANGAAVASAGASSKNKWVEVDVTSAVRASASVSFALLPRSTDAFAANSMNADANQPILVLETSTAAPPPAANAGGGTTTIVAEADTFVRASKPTTNYGTQSKVVMDKAHDGAGDTENGFLRFRIGDVGPNIDKATLRLFVADASDESATVHYISSNDWAETTVNWNTKPAVDGPPLVEIGDTKSGKWMEVDVSSVVAPNSLLSLALVPRSSDNFEIASREGSNKPQLVLTTVADDEINFDCTLIVPDKPLTPAGLATPYELVATDPTEGACHQYTVDQRGFAEAVIIDPATGQVTVYQPLVIDKGTLPAIPPVVPELPQGAVVGIWFGSNSEFLRQRGATDKALSSGRCVGGIDGDDMGQFSHCNGVAFFTAANRAIGNGRLVVPPLGMGSDGLPCPTVRDYFTVDQDQSDNVLTTYLLTSDGRLAPNTATNRARLGPTAKMIVNPSDNRVTSVLLDSALGCTPWNTPRIDNPGEVVPTLALNELLAAKWQQAPVATVPLLDPFALLEDGTPSLAKLNLHRAGVNQVPIKKMSEAENQQRDYCRGMRDIQPARLFRNQTLLSGRPSPFPDIGNSAFTFLVTRFNNSWDNLTCTDLIGLPSPITLIRDASGVTTGATLGP